jgi:hypothetical protein
MENFFGDVQDAGVWKKDAVCSHAFDGTADKAFPFLLSGLADIGKLPLNSDVLLQIIGKANNAYCAS